VTRRQAAAGGVALALAGCVGRRIGRDGARMYGLIGKIAARPGQRSALIAAMQVGETMKGNLAYVIAEDAAAPDIIWVTEIWDSEASHRASLALPGVREAIGRARPLIASLETVATTRPVAGAGTDW